MLSLPPLADKVTFLPTVPAVLSTSSRSLSSASSPSCVTASLSSLPLQPVPSPVCLSACLSARPGLVWGQAGRVTSSSLILSPPPPAGAGGVCALPPPGRCRGRGTGTGGAVRELTPHGLVRVWVYSPLFFTLSFFTLWLLLH